MSTAVLRAQFSNRLSNITLPVEIRTLSGALIRRSLVSDRVSLPAGDYVAVLRLPAGQEYQTLFSIPKTGEVEVILSADNESDHPQRARDLIRSEGPASVLLKYPAFRDAPFSKATSFGLESFAQHNVGVPSLHSIIGYEGNILSGNLNKLEGSEWLTVLPAREDAREVELECQNRKVTLIQVHRHWRKPLHLLLPNSRTDKEDLCHLVFRNTGTLDYVVEAHPGDIRADALLQYRRQGLAAEAITLSLAYAQQLLEGKIEQPVVAAVAAYTLLQWGSLEQLRDWSQNLYRRVDWLPDGVVIHGEYLARQGKPEEALDVFITLWDRGMPMFTDGLSYILNRLRLYCAREKEFAPTSLTSARELLSRLAALAASVDFTQSLVTYTTHGQDTPETVMPRRLKRIAPNKRKKEELVEVQAEALAR